MLGAASPVVWFADELQPAIAGISRRRKAKGKGLELRTIGLRS